MHGRSGRGWTSDAVARRQVQHLQCQWLQGGLDKWGHGGSGGSGCHLEEIHGAPRRQSGKNLPPFNVPPIPNLGSVEEMNLGLPSSSRLRLEWIEQALGSQRSFA
jgi:hypothetical protein